MARNASTDTSKHKQKEKDKAKAIAEVKKKNKQTNKNLQENGEMAGHGGLSRCGPVVLQMQQGSGRALKEKTVLIRKMRRT
jgi:hypothetical protein